MTSVVFILLCLGVSAVSAGISLSSAPFTGSDTEGFESFTYGPRSNFPVFGGKGSIVDSAGYVVNDQGWGLAGPAGRVHDGSYMFGHNTNANSVTTFLFPNGVTQFGGYFGYALPANAGSIFKFYSAAGLEGSLTFNYDANAQTGHLIWFGASSTVTINKIEFIAYYGLMDSLVISSAPVSVCGNGILETGEQCDSSSACCSHCAFVSASTICRASAGGCDVAETCTGSSDVCPADSFASSTFVCRQSAGDCDVAETCSGTSASCPSDSVQTSAQVCRPAANSCDVAETCDGTAKACPADLLSNSAPCFCARQGLNETVPMGYYCDNHGGYYQCLQGAWAALSSDNACPTGTVCGCTFGTECSCSGTRSPCVFPVGPGSAAQTC